jgi:hypothetical protein
MSDHEPHVSGHELREALAQNGRSRPNPLMAAEAPPAWEWTTDEQAELEELRDTTAALEAHIEDLRDAAADSRARELALHDALCRLVEARPWQKRGVVAELAGRGLI